jgi:dihydrofolate reductase
VARRIVVTEFMTLDGVVENPMWSFPYWNDETAAFKAEETDKGQHMLLGRVTYEQFAQAWPQSKDEGAAYFNPARKHVVSSTLTKDVWQNATFIRGDVRKEIERLKSESGPDLVVHGSVTLARWLLAQGLVDELRLLVYPIVGEKGRRLFEGEVPSAKLKLASCAPTSKGVLRLVYRAERAA